MNEETKKNQLEFYGGMWGAMLPIILSFCGIISTTLLGIGGYNAMLIFPSIALIVGLILVKDKRSYGDVLTKGFQKSFMHVMFICYVLAGTLSQLLRASGLMQALIWLIGELHVPVGLLPLASFLACVLISTACGTSTGTITVAGGVLLPLADALGVDLTLMCAAIISGGLFGDNLAPISDTTIASAQTQGISVQDAVRTRLPYSLIAGGLSAILFAVIGLQKHSGAIAQAVGDASYAPSLIFLALPILMIVLMVKGWSLGSCLLLSNGLCIVLGLVLNTIPLSVLISGDSPIVKGVGGMGTLLGILTLLSMLLAIPNESGALGVAKAFVYKHAHNVRGIELIMFFILIISTVCTGGSTTTIIFFGPMIKELMEMYTDQTDPCRSANMLDAVTCATCGFMPNGNPVLITIGMALALPSCDPNISFLSIAKYNYHCLFLLVLFLGSILTGIGRKRSKKSTVKDIQ